MSSQFYNLIRLMNSSNDAQAVNAAIPLLEEFMDEKDVDPWSEIDGVSAVDYLINMPCDSVALSPLFQKILQHPSAPIKTLHARKMSSSLYKKKGNELELTFVHVLAAKKPDLVDDYVKAGGSLAAYAKNDVGVMPFIRDGSHMEKWLQHAQKENVDLTGGDEKVSWISVRQKWLGGQLSSQDLSAYQRTVGDLLKKYPIVLTEEEKFRIARREFVHAIRTLPGKNVVSSSMKLHGLEKIAKKDEEFYRNCVEAFKDAVGSRLGVSLRDEHGYHVEGVPKNEQGLLKTMANWFISWGEKCFPDADTGLKPFLSLYANRTTYGWRNYSKAFVDFTESLRHYSYNPLSPEEKMTVLKEASAYIQHRSVIPSSFAASFGNPVPTQWSDIVELCSLVDMGQEVGTLPIIAAQLPSNPTEEDKVVVGKVFLSASARATTYSTRGDPFWDKVTKGFSGSPTPEHLLMVECLETYLQSFPEVFTFDDGRASYGDINRAVQNIVTRENLKKEVVFEEIEPSERKLRM